MQFKETNQIFRLLSWFRELGLGLLIYSLFLTWLIDPCTKITTRGLDGLDNPFFFSYYAIVWIAYILSKQKRRIPSQISAIVFGAVAILFYTVFFIIISFGQHCTIDMPYGVGPGVKYSLWGTVVFALGILSNLVIRKDI